MHLTPEEERYKQKIRTEINGLVGAYLTLTEPDYKRLMDKVEAETLVEGSAYTFTAIVAVPPEVKLGDYRNFPPTILTAGTRDLFLSNTVRVHRKLRRAGVDQVASEVRHGAAGLDIVRVQPARDHRLAAPGDEIK